MACGRLGFRFDKFADFERILLLRRGRELMVSETFWTPELLARLLSPYERRSMPYLEA